MRWLIIPSLLTACSGEFDTKGAEVDTGPTVAEPSAEANVDNDGDGFTPNEGDCDDDDESVNPDAQEIPGDGIDNDCVDGDAAGEMLTAGELIITEIMNNPSALPDETGEWFELHNPTSQVLDLTGLLVRDSASSESFTISGVTIGSGASITLGNNSDPTLNGGVQHAFIYSDFNLSNSGDEIVLEMNGSIIDEVDYGASGFPDPNGASMSLAPEYYDSVANDDGANWCVSSIPTSSGDYATPNSINASCAPPEPDADGDGYDATAFGGEDCDDLNATVNPGATENPSNGIDDDCDGQIDEAVDPNDVDGDGYDSIASGGDDCDDTDPNVNPGALETGPNNIDENCDFILEDGLCNDDCGYPDDGACDDGAFDAEYAVCDFGSDCSDCGVREDLDQDGAYDAGGWPPLNSDLLSIADCDDADPVRYPEAVDIANDGIDQDCDGADYTLGLCADTCPYPADGYCDDGGPNASYTVCAFGTDCTDCGSRDDSDQDGFYDDQGTTPSNSDLDGIMDCDDSDPAINPDIVEIADDGIDQDCNGQDLQSLCDDSCGIVDGVCDDGGTNSAYDICALGTDCTDCGPRIDEDGDLYDVGSDCDDLDPMSNPGIALDDCDGVDNDCDNAYDEDFDSTEPSDASNPSYLGSLETGTLATSGYLTYSSDLDAYTFYAYDGWTTSPDFRCDIGAPPNVDAYVRLYDPSGSLIASTTSGLGGSTSVSFSGGWGDDTGDYRLELETASGMSCSIYVVSCYYD